MIDVIYLTGKQLNKINKHKPFHKFIDKDKIKYDSYKYIIGENKREPYGRFLTFTTIDNMFNILKEPDYYHCEIEIQDDSDCRIYKNNIYESDKIIIKSMTPVSYFIEWFDKSFCLKMVRQCGWNLQFVKQQNESLCWEALKSNPWAIQFVNKQTEEMCLYVLPISWGLLEYIREQTEEMCLISVKQFGLALEYANIQTVEICLEAVKNCGISLKYVKNQTKEICMEAVKESWVAIQYVNDKTDEICQEAIKQDKRALKLIKPIIYDNADY